MSKVDNTAQILYAYLSKHRNKAYRIRDLIDANGLRNNATTATAMKRIRSWAIDDGLCLRLPCPANGHTYALTDDPNMVYDAVMHMWLIADGVKRTEEQMRAFVRRNDQMLPRGDRRIVEIVDRFEESQRAQQGLIHELIGVTVETRRESRRHNGDGNTRP